MSFFYDDDFPISIYIFDNAITLIEVIITHTVNKL